ncbi:hypothetical protein [Nocardioides sp. TF02-7]|uniref:hypothetical protein n=1 Tax=Nocardioides sp. TF02-7 TaxID=2917724 RepID=UPI001F05460A|nr:hypothetical protein [Nocardioides sp. TF02-7]UMG93917.1 hypothetical protein MF408_07355 [Nocardioides sp. TF02-7]
MSSAPSTASRGSPSSTSRAPIRPPTPTGPRPTEGDGCYRVEVTGEPHLRLELTHHGERGDHNVSGMIVTAQRLVNAVPAVVAARPGLVTPLDLPLVTGRGLVRR